MTNPVAIFAFRRPAMLQQLLQDLTANDGADTTPVTVFSDAAHNASEQAAVTAVRDLCRDFPGFASLTLVERERNLGCAANVIDGVSRLLQEHSAVVVLEEDLRVAPGFLSFMNRALAIYRERQDIFSVSAFAAPPEQVGMPANYTADVYLSRRNASWGWATWADRWRQVDWAVGDFTAFRHDRDRWRAFDLGGDDLSPMLDAQMAGEIDSWSIRFSYAHFLHQAYSVCPRWSYSDHAGDDGSGTHVPKGGGLRVDLASALPAPMLPADLQPDANVLRTLKRFHSESWQSVLLGRVPGMRSLVKAVKKRLGIQGPLL